MFSGPPATGDPERDRLLGEIFALHERMRTLSVELVGPFELPPDLTMQQLRVLGLVAQEPGELRVVGKSAPKVDAVKLAQGKPAFVDDVKFAGLLGMGLGWLGWSELLVGGFLGFLLGGLWGLALIVSRRAGRGSSIPFGPFMYAGTILGIVLGADVAAWYLGTTLG